MLQDAKKGLETAEFQRLFWRHRERAGSDTRKSLGRDQTRGSVNHRHRAVRCRSR
jgi:hypothetical protein